MIRSSLLVLVASVTVAIVLALLPLPESMLYLRPFWLALVVCYWLLEREGQVGLGVAFATGLLLDLALGSLLGEHAFRLVVIGFLLNRFRSRFRFYPVWQQALAIGGLLLNDLVVTAVIHAVARLEQPAWQVLGSVPLGALLWPPVHALLARLDRGRR